MKIKHHKRSKLMAGFRAGVCHPCVETDLTATKKSATDGN